MENRTTSHRIAAIALLAVIALSLPLVGGLFGRFHPAFDSLAHFRMHLAVALILAAVPLLLVRGFRWNGFIAAVLGVWAILNVTGASGIPVLNPVQAAYQPKDAFSPGYRLLHLNLRYDNPEPGKVLSLIGRVRPDVVTLNEVSGMWMSKLALLSSAYPYRVVCVSDSRVGGVAILSLRPFAGGMKGQCLDSGVLAIAPIDFGGRFADVATLHLRWPWPFDQAGQIDKLAPLLAAMPVTSILAGDLNAAPWSASSARVAEAAAMKPVGPAGPTWLYKALPDVLRFAGLPIDRVFAKGGVVVHSVQTMEPVGSDHLPVLVEFSLTPAEPKSEDPMAAQAALASLRGACAITCWDRPAPRRPAAAPS